MHADGNIRYANYQSEDQMKEYLTSNGHESIISDIIGLINKCIRNILNLICLILFCENYC